MLSDEEKHAIEFVKSELQDEKIARNDYQSLTGLYGNLEIETVLNLIEKQSKEIEHQIEKRANQRNELAILNAKQVEFNKLVNTVNSYKGQFKKQQKEIEELNYIKRCFDYCVEQKNKKWKDKIKAKIEEVKDGTFDAKIVLQSLLEKE